ncbi:unnamed protein product [Prorocentrum cordatum]|nr:unnamed protein product [Polarella glacialis]
MLEEMDFSMDDPAEGPAAEASGASGGPGGAAGAGAAASSGAGAAASSGAAAAVIADPDHDVSGFRWRQMFQFTPHWNRTTGQQAGWEVFCYHPDHDQSKCRRRRHFAAHGGPQMTERLLKEWCIRGLCEGGTAAHMALKDHPPYMELEQADDHPIPEHLLDALASSSGPSSDGNSSTSD